MERRGFIKTGLTTVAASASGHLAFGEILVPMAENVSHSEMENFIREMDFSMDHILHAGGNYIKSLLPETPSADEQTFFRSGLRTLLLIGNFGDLPIKGQVHPWVQKRMMYSAPEVNFSVTTSYDILRNMPDETLEEARTALVENPDLGEKILETLDLEARSIGVPAARRRQMRVMGTRIVRRMRHSPEMLIDEYVKKADKLLLASNSDDAMHHFLKMQMGEEKYSTRKNEAEAAALQWKSLNIPDISIGYDTVITEQDNHEQPKEAVTIKNRKGLGLLGIGLIITAAGWLSVAIAGGTLLGAILGITVGPVLILIALIILLIKSSKSAKPQE